ncbi:MAG: hybrid sensor histidine kinase/response regulator [Gemmataceae bacterium]|nr:hybrid sensor histidine kinase/response regulator [Gemmata sp.]MDW8196069.1 hybrid sensor histidine kinase/response regulator [Gemmataceae bacterium]
MIPVDDAMFELFREEVRAHADTLAAGLITLDPHSPDPALLESLMRAAHSIKGAARIVGIDAAVRLAHVMEDALVAAQAGSIRLTAEDIDDLLQGTDRLAQLATLTSQTVAQWETDNAAAVEQLEPRFRAMAQGTQRTPASSPTPSVSPQSPPSSSPTPPRPSETSPQQRAETPPQERGEQPTADTPSPTVGFPPPPAFERANIPKDPFPLPPEHGIFDLFREEVRSYLLSLQKLVPALATDPTATDTALETLKFLRGAARLAKCEPVAELARAITQYLHATREQHQTISPEGQNWLHYAIATLAPLLTTDEENFPAWVASEEARLAEVSRVFLGVVAASARRQAIAPSPPVPPSAPPSSQPEPKTASAAAAASTRPSITTDREDAPRKVFPQMAESSPASQTSSTKASSTAPAEAVVRVTAQSLSRLMGLAGESLVQARWLPTFSTALLKLKKQHDLLATMLDSVFHAAVGGAPPALWADWIAQTRQQLGQCRRILQAEMANFDDHAARAEDLNTRLYREVITSRMRPFADGVHALPRLVRDMARTLGKEARLVVLGERTEVDRDILERLESPLAHLVRNAVDHGLETPDVRTAHGKSPAGTITIEARHRAGMLLVTVSDDGAGIDLQRLRQKVIEKGLNTPEVVARLTDNELLEFLFLPGFSTAPQVTEFSGRGVGLDVVQDTIRRVGGNVRITTTRGQGTTFHLQLPLTLSVIRAVVADIAGEPYAFPHTRIDRLIRVRRDQVRSLEHRQFVTVDGQNVGLVMASQMLDIPSQTPPVDELPVILLSDASGEYGLVVDRFHGEQDLVVRPLDPRLGKVPNLSAAAILDDGSPVLIVDVEDMIRSMDQYIQTGSLVPCDTRPPGRQRRKRVLVVDDSITVREVERQLLLNQGYEVSVAVDGADGWNQVRAGTYDLLITDVDMPRMNGLQLVQAVRADEKLRDLPVIIVSYKERDEDRTRGLEVGANAYLTKSSFHDNRFIEAVVDLIGPADQLY